MIFRTQAVCDDERGAAFHQRRQSFLNQGFAIGIEA
jgi:hypothetical protein